MPRKPNATLNEHWQYALGDIALYEAFLRASELLIEADLVPEPATQFMTVALKFEQVTGTIAEVREGIKPEDLEAIERLHFTLIRPGESGKPAIILEVSPNGRHVNMRFEGVKHLSSALGAIRAVKSCLPEGSTDAQETQEPVPQQPEKAASPVPALLRLFPGAQVDHYRLIRRLGAGFSGEVWQAEVVTPPPGVQLVSGEAVAMKQYFPIALTRNSDSLRIQREFRVASDLRHPNLVRVHDMVISPSRPFHSFLIMELVPGETLKSKIPREGFDWRTCVQVGIQIAAALAELHGYGALHRDIKPANIMVLPGQELRLKLLDLGIVSLIAERGLTEGSVFLGSKHTSAPEQLFGEELDERADVYSLGATLYQCYRSKPLYDEGGPVTAIVRAMLGSPRTCEPKDRTRCTPEEERFVQLLNQCLSIDAAQRPSTARIFWEHLAALNSKAG